MANKLLMRLIFSFAAFILTAGANISLSQSYKDIMNKGIDVKPDSKMYLRYDGASPNQVLKYNFTGNTVDFKTLDTTYYFIITEDQALNVFIQPVNPLSSKTASEVFFSTDEIDKNANEGLTGLLKIVNPISAAVNVDSNKGGDMGPNKGGNIDLGLSNTKTQCSQDIENIIVILDSLSNSVADNKDKELKLIFEDLKNLDFSRHTVVESALEEAKDNISNLEKHYSKQETLLTKLEGLVNGFSCKISPTEVDDAKKAIEDANDAAKKAADSVVYAADATEQAAKDTKNAKTKIQIAAAAKATKAAAIATKDAAEATKDAAEKLAAAQFNARLAPANDGTGEGVDKDKTFQIKTLAFLSINELKEKRNEQLSRLKSISSIKKIVDEVYNKATFGSDGISWYTQLDEIPINKGKISNLNVKLSDAGYNIGENNFVETKETLNKSYKIKFRKYQRFIPEVSSGIAYVNNITFHKYGTSLDEATDKYVVTDAGEEEIRRFNVTSMINFYDYRYAGEDFFPYLQLGAGTNLETPAVFLGGGFNFFGGNLSNLSISAGGVGLFRKELNDLKIGDVITGTAELEKDLSFQPKVRWYFSLQWHLTTL